ncbi:hypothetical protein PVAP13_3NG195600 [Panicum virgatum]|uniref:Uncharacterized protein n=1 Tax=Panicum virgatum TaxID=38727 RepID=A0A8T0UEZ3_PANVG|nr:hypothetical protein PVAP13_3NG195600 [Panicum virgatum]
MCLVCARRRQGSGAFEVARPHLLFPGTGAHPDPTSRTAAASFCFPSRGSGVSSSPLVAPVPIFSSLATAPVPAKPALPVPSIPISHAHAESPNEEGGDVRLEEVQAEHI